MLRQGPQRRCGVRQKVKLAPMLLVGALLRLLSRLKDVIDGSSDAVYQECHRDIVGACNILTKHQYGTLIPNDLFPYPEAKYLRIPFVPKGKSSSSPDGGLVVVKGRKSTCDLASASNQ